MDVKQIMLDKFRLLKLADNGIVVGEKCRVVKCPCFYLDLVIWWRN